MAQGPSARVEDARAVARPSVVPGRRQGRQAGDVLALASSCHRPCIRSTYSGDTLRGGLSHPHRSLRAWDRRHAGLTTASLRPGGRHPTVTYRVRIPCAHVPAGGFPRRLARPPLRDRVSKRRVAITGLGVLSPLGQTLPGVAASLKSGASGIRLIQVPIWRATTPLGSLTGSSPSCFRSSSGRSWTEPMRWPSPPRDRLVGEANFEFVDRVP